MIHKLIKDKHGPAKVVVRNAPLVVTDPVKKLVIDIHNLYASRASKGYGRFEADETNYPSAKILRECFKDSTLNFIEASKQLLSVLSAKASQVPLATGGYVLMAQVTNAANVSWFIAAIINNVDASAINDASLDVVNAVHVDLENLRVAGRVALNDWLGGDPEARYVGFLKQRGDVAGYFKLFLGCNELIANTVETKKLVGVLKEFARSEGLDSQKTEEFLSLAYNVCQGHVKEDSPISLENLSNAIWPTEPAKLRTALATADVQISDGFVPDGRVIKSFVKIKAKAKYWSIDLDRHALVSGDARYNKQKGELVLRNLPDSLRAELDNEINNAD